MPSTTHHSSHRRHHHQHHHQRYQYHKRKPSKPTSTHPVLNWLRLLTTVTSLTSLTLFALAIPTWNANFFHPSTPNSGDWTDGLPLLPLSISILVNIYSIARQRSILLLDILLTLSLPPVLTVAGLTALFPLWHAAIPGADGKVVCDMSNIFARECEPILYRIGGLELGGIVVGGVVWVAHLGFMALGCVRLRSERLGRRKVERKGSASGKRGEKVVLATIEEV